MFATFYKNVCEGDTEYKFMGFKKPVNDFLVYPWRKNLGLEIKHGILIQFPENIYQDYMNWHEDSNENHFCICDMDTFYMKKIDNTGGNGLIIEQTLGVKIDLQARFDYEQRKFKEENGIK